jgi:hypothetical protein
VHHLVWLYVATDLADFFGMYTRKTSSKYGETLIEHVSYPSIDKAMVHYYRITGILNKKKKYVLFGCQQLYQNIHEALII